jgi:hypothetical protein
VLTSSSIAVGQLGSSQRVPRGLTISWQSAELALLVIWRAADGWPAGGARKLVDIPASFEIRVGA